MWMCALPESVTVGLATSFPRECVGMYQDKKYEVFFQGLKLQTKPAKAGTFGLSSLQAFALLLFIQIKGD